MRRTLLLTIAFVLALVPSAGAAEPRIALGVAAGGVDVSGLTLAEAEAKLAAANAPLVDRQISAQVAGRTFIVTPEKHLDFAFDARKSARRAYNAGLKPHTTPINVELYVKYSSKKLTAWTYKVRSAVDRAPRDARVNIGLRRIQRVTSRDGRTIDVSALYEAARAALRDQAADARAAAGAQDGQAEDHDRRPGERLRHDHHDRPRQLQTAAVQAPEALEDVRGRGRHAGLPDADGPVLDLQQGRESRPGRRPTARGPGPTRTRPSRAAAPRIR